MAEIAENRAKTSTSYNARDASDWPDGGRYPDNHVRVSVRTRVTISRLTLLLSE
jgi:hypothetical protein